MIMIYRGLGIPTCAYLLLEILIELKITTLKLHAGINNMLLLKYAKKVS